MEKNLNKIHDYLLKIGVDVEIINDYDKSTIGIAKEIMYYAHRNQKRVNDEPYYVHPLGIYKLYEELNKKKHLVLGGVYEVCLLHDVVEDTEFGFDDIRNIYKELGYADYYDKYIDISLRNVTHDKSMPYDDYIDIVMTNEASALVKMLDLQNNSNLLTLDTLDESNLERSIRYLKYIYKINNKYHFIEAFNKTK